MLKYQKAVLFTIVLLIIFIGNSEVITKYHRYNRRIRSVTDPFYPDELDQNYWRAQAQKTLLKKLKIKPNENIAKNIIFFLGDGMSFPTLAATRVYMGQLNKKPGEESELFFETFPYTALSKTYCVDKQVADSACSATAYLCGVKANDGTIGLSAAVPFSDCEKSKNGDTHLSSIARWSQLQNKRTGVVTTTRVTHASPAGIYGNIAHRDWESDKNLKDDKINPEDCSDIANQLIYSHTGKELNVILGGGRSKFLPKPDGERLDGRNLVNEWEHLKANLSQHSKYVKTREELLQVPEDIDYLLGLFASSHLNFNLDRLNDEPSLSEMTESAIKILNKGENGFFLFVEGGRIDHGHHENKAHKALDETVQFNKAIETAYGLTNPEETLIIVTADHAHVMSLNGYADRGNSIFQFAGIAEDELPYATISYANGPGYHKEENGRYNLTEEETKMAEKDYVFPAFAPLNSETHGGDDVGIYATGPWAHLFAGVMEQNVIPHILAYASCVTPNNGLVADGCRSSSISKQYNMLLVIFSYLILTCIIRY